MPVAGYRVRRTLWTLLPILAIALTSACGGEATDREGNGTADGERPALTVISANIYLGGKKDPGLERTACYLANADVAFLQEVDREAAEVLARESGLANLRFAKDEGLHGGEYGVAIMSRFPLGLVEARTLPGTRAGYDLILKAVARRRGEPVTLMNAFYAAGYNEAGREGRLRASEVALSMLEEAEHPVIFGGDLNASPGRPGIGEISAELTDSRGAARGGSFHCEEPFGLIDYVFYRGPFVALKYEAPCWPLGEDTLFDYEGPGCSLVGTHLSDHPFVRVELGIAGEL